jgi:hypothetical protein
MKASNNIVLLPVLNTFDLHAAVGICKYMYTYLYTYEYLGTVLVD